MRPILLCLMFCAVFGLMLYPMTANEANANNSTIGAPALDNVTTPSEVGVIGNTEQAPAEEQLYAACNKSRKGIFQRLRGRRGGGGCASLNLNGLNSTRTMSGKFSASAQLVIG